MKSALWFLVRFLVLSLLMAMVYWQTADKVNRVFVVLVNSGLEATDAFYRVKLPTKKLTHIDVFTKDGQFYSQLDGLPFHFNLVPLLGLFLATPHLSLRKKLLHTLIAVLLATPTYMGHVYLNLVELHRWDIIIFQYSFWSWLSSVSFYLLIQVLRFGSVFMKQSGSLFVPFLIWILFYMRMLRFYFYPEDRIRSFLKTRGGI